MNLKSPIPPTSPDAGPGRLPIVLTALVWPGLGQLVQTRWLAGIGYGLAFLVCGGFFFVHAGHIMVSYYNLAFDMGEPNKTSMAIKPMVIWLVLSLVTYLAALLDCIFAYTRERAQWHRERRGPLLPPELATPERRGGKQC